MAKLDTLVYPVQVASLFNEEVVADRAEPDELVAAEPEVETVAIVLTTVPVTEPVTVAVLLAGTVPE